LGSVVVSGDVVVGTSKVAARGGLFILAIRDNGARGGGTQGVGDPGRWICGWATHSCSIHCSRFCKLR